MKKLKTLMAALMAATMVLTMTGCEEEDPNASVSKTTNDVEMEDQAVEEAAKALVGNLSYPDLKVTKRIKWMGWWPLDETSGECILFKEVYGIPETGENPADEGRIFEYSAVEYGSRYDTLATAIASDESPDIFPFEIADFPYGVLMNRYQAVDDVVDFSEEKWARTRELNEQFALNGKHYTTFTSYSLADLMWYKKSNIAAIGADDPQELFNQGKWDWTAFLNIADKWQQSGTTDTPRFVCDGWKVDTSLICSTGVPVVGTDGGKLVNNLHTAEVERAVTDVIAKLQRENLRYPRHELNEWAQNPNAWANDQTLFFCEGTWRYEEDLQMFKRRFKWADDEIKVVPYPKDPKADKQYVELKADCYMWVKGSTNKEGVQAWYDCLITTSNDVPLHEASNAKLIKNTKQGYTKEIIDFLDTLYGYNGESPVTPVVEFKTGLGPNVDNGTMDCPVGGIVGKVYLTGESFTTTREEYEGAIQKAIDDINAKI